MVSIRELAGRCSITVDGRPHLNLTLRFDPARAMRLLEQMNRLVDIDGRPIYANYNWRGIALWPLLQERLFSTTLRPFVRYRDVLKLIEETPSDHVATDIPTLQTLLDLSSEQSTQSFLRVRTLVRNLFELTFYVINTLLCAAYCQVRGITWLLYTTHATEGEQWTDYRLKDVYAGLWSRRQPFLEVVPFAGFKLAIQRLRKGRRLAWFFPALQPLRVEHHRYATDGFVGSERFVANVIREYERRASALALQSQMTAALLPWLGITRVIGIDDHTHHGPLIAACKSLGYETIGLQHGVFHKYSVGWRCPAIPEGVSKGYDRIYVWGEYWRDLLAELSTLYRREQLIPAGFIRPSDLHERRRASRPIGERPTVLLPFEFLANPDEIAGFVTAFVEKGFKVLFKVRFDDPLERQLHALPRENLVLIETLTRAELEEIDVCAGTSTTMMYELYAMGIPIWFLRTKHDSNSHMVERGLASEISLEMIRSDSFVPGDHCIVPGESDSLFSSGQMPEVVVRLASG